MIATKRCSRCKELRPLEYFKSRSTTRDGFYCYCDYCSKIIWRGWACNEPERTRKRDRARRKLNPESHRNRCRRYRARDPERTRAQWRKANKKPKTVQASLAAALRSRTNVAIKGNAKRGSAIADLGCCVAALKTYLESKFWPGMSWDNWGKDGWHIDHIIPLACYDLTKRADFLKACHYTNLQPLWAKDNLMKGAKII